MWISEAGIYSVLQQLYLRGWSGVKTRVLTFTVPCSFPFRRSALGHQPLPHLPVPRKNLLAWPIIPEPFSVAPGWIRGALQEVGCCDDHRLFSPTLCNIRMVSVRVEKTGTLHQALTCLWLAMASASLPQLEARPLGQGVFGFSDSALVICISSQRLCIFTDKWETVSDFLTRLLAGSVTHVPVYLLNIFAVIGTPVQLPVLIKCIASAEKSYQTLCKRDKQNYKSTINIVFIVLLSLPLGTFHR